MCTPVTIEDVRQFMPAAAATDDATLQMYCDLTSEQDQCLIGAGVSAAKAKALKLNYIAHLISMSSGASGEVVSERSPTGESVQYAAPATQGSGLAASSYGRVVLSLDTSGCFTSATKPQRFFFSVG
jgi:hypothetical protein